MYLTLDQAVNRTRRLTNNPEFTIGNLKQIAEAGVLKICFHYRGSLGVFEYPAQSLPPMPEQIFYFDGYLRSLTEPRLFSKVWALGQTVQIDQLTPTRVEIVSTKFPDHTIDIQPPKYYGRVRDSIKLGNKSAQPAMLESKPIPEADWLICSDDLSTYINAEIAATTAQTRASVVAGGPATDCAEFLAMENIAASEVSIAFVGDKGEQGLVLGANNMLAISVREVKKRVSLNSLDLIDKRSGRLNSQGAVLLGMAEKRKLPNTPVNIKKVQRLREALCSNLGIKGDPFQHFLKGTGWTPLFTLADNRGAADKRAKDKAEFRQPSIEQLNTLGRHFAAPDQPNDPIDRGERANQRRQDFPADEWMQKNGHTYEGEGYDNDN